MPYILALDQGSTSSRAIVVIVGGATGVGYRRRRGEPRVPMGRDRSLTITQFAG